LWAVVAGSRLTASVERLRPSAANTTDTGTAGQVHSPMAGKLLRLLVRVGENVEVGQALAVVEAMKMENELSAPVAGCVLELPLAAPGAVDKGALVARIGAR
jgi:biotin carboxyl carrier protein